jgi:opacity protein-like surface antigen
MKKSWMLVGIFSLLCFANPLHAQDKFEVFGGYSYIWGSVNLLQGGNCVTLPCPPPESFNGHINLNGWEASGLYKFTDAIGVVADFGGNYGSAPSSGGGSSIHRETYMFGPQFSYPARVSPFVHALFGGAHQSVGAGSLTGISFASSSNAFAMAFGAGIDIKVSPLVSFRPIQLDYLTTRFNSAWQSQPRISAGVVFHF